MRNLIHWRTLSLLTGLALAGTVGAQAQTTNLLSLTTFEPDATPSYGYGYFYGDNGLGAQQFNKGYYLPEDTGQTNAMYQYTFDLTALNGAVGYGTGTGAPLFLTGTDPASFVSTNREDYIFTFDARVEGLAPGVSSANAEMQVQFYYPNDAGTATKSLQVNIPFAPTADWKTFTYTLDQGALGDNTTEAEFALHAAATSDVRFNVNLDQPHTAFGYDADNALYLDNLKLQVVAKPAVPPPPTFGVAIAEWNFDDKTPWYEYHYEWSANDTHAVADGGNNANGAAPNSFGKDGGSGWFLNLDTTGFNDNPPAFAGGGTGGGGPVDYTLFNSANLADYRVSFEARAQGLADGQTLTSASLQLFLDAPDDTIQPADADTSADRVAQLNFPIGRLTTDWQTYSFLLSKGSVGGGSVANFISFFNKISDLRTQWQIENAGAITDWGFDADNYLVIDNFKLERLYTGLGALSATRSGNNIVLTWNSADPTVRLQSASSVTGPYTDVQGAVSGISIPATGSQGFFRLVQAPSAP